MKKQSGLTEQSALTSSDRIQLYLSKAYEAERKQFRLREKASRIFQRMEALEIQLRSLRNS